VEAGGSRSSPEGISGSPTRNIRFPDKEYQVPRQGISGSPTRNIRFPTGGYNLLNSKIIVLYVQLMLTHENV
jgi:hypothetical protein